MTGRVVHAAVVGASTLLGKELVGEIAESAAAAWDLRLLGDAENDSQLTAAGEEALVIHKLGATSLEGMDVVFFASTAEEAQGNGAAALRAGAGVVDLSGGLRGEADLLVRSPWIDQGRRPDLMTRGVLTPHPAALMLALAADRLLRRFGAVVLTATVLEPASEAGAAGGDELHQQTVGRR